MTAEENERIAFAAEFKEAEKLFICGICLEVVRNPVRIACSHKFCSACLKKTITDKEKTVFFCPQCREKFSERNVRCDDYVERCVSSLRNIELAFRVDTQKTLVTPVKRSRHTREGYSTPERVHKKLSYDNNSVDESDRCFRVAPLEGNVKVRSWIQNNEKMENRNEEEQPSTSARLSPVLVDLDDTEVCTEESDSDDGIVENNVIKETRSIKSHASSKSGSGGESATLRNRKKYKDSEKTQPKLKDVWKKMNTNDNSSDASKVDLNDSRNSGLNTTKSSWFKVAQVGKEMHVKEKKSKPLNISIKGNSATKSNKSVGNSANVAAGSSSVCSNSEVGNAAHSQKRRTSTLEPLEIILEDDDSPVGANINVDKLSRSQIKDIIGVSKTPEKFGVHRFDNCTVEKSPEYCSSTPIKNTHFRNRLHNSPRVGVICTGSKDPNASEEFYRANLQETPAKDVPKNSRIVSPLDVDMEQDANSSGGTESDKMSSISIFEVEDSTSRRKFSINYAGSGSTISINSSATANSRKLLTSKNTQQQPNVSFRRHLANDLKSVEAGLGDNGYTRTLIKGDSLSEGDSKTARFYKLGRVNVSERRGLSKKIDSASLQRIPFYKLGSLKYWGIMNYVDAETQTSFVQENTERVKDFGGREMHTTCASNEIEGNSTYPLEIPKKNLKTGSLGNVSLDSGNQQKSLPKVVDVRYFPAPVSECPAVDVEVYSEKSNASSIRSGLQSVGCSYVTSPEIRITQELFPEETSKRKLESKDYEPRKRVRSEPEEDKKSESEDTDVCFIKKISTSRRRISSDSEDDSDTEKPVEVPKNDGKRRRLPSNNSEDDIEIPEIVNGWVEGKKNDACGFEKDDSNGARIKDVSILKEMSPISKKIQDQEESEETKDLVSDNIWQLVNSIRDRSMRSRENSNNCDNVRLQANEVQETELSQTCEKSNDNLMSDASVDAAIANVDTQNLSQAKSRENEKNLLIIRSSENREESSQKLSLSKQESCDMYIPSSIETSTKERRRMSNSDKENQCHRRRKEPERESRRSPLDNDGEVTGTRQEKLDSVEKNCQKMQEKTRSREASFSQVPDVQKQVFEKLKNSQGRSSCKLGSKTSNNTSELNILGKNSANNAKESQESFLNITQDEQNLRRFREEFCGFSGSSVSNVKDQKAGEQLQKTIQKEPLLGDSTCDEKIEDLSIVFPSLQPLATSTQKPVGLGVERSQKKILESLNLESESNTCLQTQDQVGQKNPWNESSGLPNPIPSRCEWSPQKKAGESMPSSDKNEQTITNHKTRVPLVTTGESSNPREEPLDGQQLCFVVTKLNVEQIHKVQLFAKKVGAKFQKNFTPEVSHVIVTRIDGKSNKTDQTLKFIEGITHKKWIVVFEWVQQCLNEGRIVEEEPYEATDSSGYPGPRRSRLTSDLLFKNFVFHCIQPITYPTLQQYQKILEVNGGTLIKSLPEFAVNSEKLKVLLMESDYHTKPAMNEWVKKTRAVPVEKEWITECISRYEVIPISSHYLLNLSKEDVLQLGFPQNLVGSDDDEEAYSE